MNKTNRNLSDGYLESIEKGLKVARGFKKNMVYSERKKSSDIEELMNEIEEADAIVIGAGAGLSTSAGFTYSGERFERYFFDFIEKFGIRDMYSGGFYSFPDAETHWAWWSRQIYFNRYVETPKPVYKDLFDLIKDKNYFVITTNVDHQFQKSGFDKNRLFYTQGDFGLFKSVNTEIQKTYDNEDWVVQAIEAQGFVRDSSGYFKVPDDKDIQMRIPTDLIPKCIDDGSDVDMNLRVDGTFVQDEGWYRASDEYSKFIKEYKNSRVLYLELGIGANTPVIIKYPFWYMTMENENSTYVCLNYGEAFCPTEIKERSICINADIGEIIQEIKKMKP